jgi:hypothetical protein
MNKIISSVMLTVVAVPFLMAAPAAKKVQNSTAPAATTAKKSTKTHVKHVKAVKPTAAAATTAPVK